MMCKAKAWVLALAAGLLLLLIPAQARADVTRLLILNDEQTSETSAAATDVLRRFALYSSWTCTFVSSEDVPDTDGYTAVIICTDPNRALNASVVLAIQESKLPVFVIGAGGLAELTKTQVYEGSLTLRLQTQANAANDMLLSGNSLLLMKKSGESLGGQIFVGAQAFPLCQTAGNITHLAYFDPSQEAQCAFLSTLLQTWLWPYKNSPTAYGQYLVLDRIYPFADPERLLSLVEMLEMENVPYVLCVMPIYANADYPAMKRFCEVLRYALRRVGRDSFAAIARDVVNASGWFVRLAQRGPEGKAIAANVLKALDAVAEAEAEFGNSPRSIALAFDRFLAGKEAPGALNEEGDGAVRIMTVHASKGLEYPVVAVAECFGVRKPSGAAQMGRVDGGAQVVALPARFDGVKLADGTFVKGDDVKKQFEHAFKGKGTSLWLPPELMEDVCATGSPAEAFARLRNDDLQLSLEERARLLYVAMTRARELVILAMDAGVSRGKVTAPTFDVETDLTYDVLRRILPTNSLDMPQLDGDRLVFDNSQPGDYELISLADFTFGEQAFEANASLDAEGRLVRGDVDVADNAARSTVPGPADPKPDSFELVYPQAVGVRMGICPYPMRDSYSYSSIAAALHAESEDRAAEARVPMDESGDDAESDGSEMTDADVAAVEPVGNPMALGSAFHAACQWLIEMGANALPAARADALARLWRLTPEQRERFDVALERWLKSSVRAELFAWPCVRAEVPFFSLGCEDEDIARYGAYAEGAIDALATDPADPSCALVIDYKTGGTPDETPEQLLEKHALQARVYADVLHKAGFEAVTVKFVRVEQANPTIFVNSAEPQVVTYNL